MLRIIGGEFRHRKLALPEVETSRPTMDKVREAVFSSIHEKVPNSVFLDLFAGSGAVGLEALSRGSSKVFFNEIDRKVQKTLVKNILTFDSERKSTVLLSKDYADAIRYLSDKGQKFDIVYMDPPYSFGEISKIVTSLYQNGLLNPKALAIVEETIEPVSLPNFVLKVHRYGKKYIGTYELTEVV